MNDPAVVWRDSNTMDVFCIGDSDGALYHAWFQYGPGWSGWENLGGTLVGNPSVTINGPGRIDVLARADQSVWQITWEWGTGWSGWHPILPWPG